MSSRFIPGRIQRVPVAGWFFVAACLVLQTAASRAATWTGGSAVSDAWTDADNWGGTAPAAAEALAFGGTMRLTPSNDYPAGTPFGGLSFLSGVGRFTLSGSAIDLTGDITSAAMSNQTINVGLTLTADTLIHISGNYATSRITLGGGITGNHNLTLSGTYQYGDNRVTFAGANSYEGTTTVGATGNKVTAWVTNLAGIPGAVVVTDGSTLRLRPAVPGGTFANDISIAGQGAQSFGWASWAGRVNAGALVLNNNVNVAGTVTLTGNAVISANRDDTGTTGMQGYISGRITGAHSLTFGFVGEQPGTIWISNPGNDWTGDTLVTGGGATGSSGRRFRLELGAANVIPHGAGAGNVTVNNQNSAVDTNGHDQNINGLSGNQLGASFIGGGVLTLGNGDADGNFLGTLAVGQLVKTGSGNQQLRGYSTVSGPVAVDGGTLTVSGGYLTSGPITVAAGANLILDGPGAELRYTSASDYSGPFTFTRGKLTGTNWRGSLDGLTVGRDRSISPGAGAIPGQAQTGTQTWSPGGAYVFEINHAEGTAGVNWDRLSLSGQLGVAGLSPATPFTVYLVSLDASNAAGKAVPGFDPAATYEWELVSAGSLSNALRPDDLVVNTNGFVNVCHAAFSIKQDRTSLKLVYNLPKPATLVVIR